MLLVITINASSAKAGDEVLVDGVLIDNGGRNHYDKDKGLKIVRMANPTTGANATPDTQGIHVLLGEGSKCTIQNCVVTNCAPSGLTGAIHVHAMEKCTTTIRNNLVANNTGTGIQLTYGGAAKEGPTLPQFTVNENSILFCWLFEPSASHGGSALKMDGGAVVNAASNVFAFCDQYAVDNARRSKGLTLKDNLFGSCGLADYLEFGTKIAFKDLEDNAECLAKETGGNVQNKLELNLDPQWAVGFAARTLVDRAKAEAGSKVENTVENQLRAMFGMNLKGTAVDLSSEVWLHRIKLEHAIACGSQKQSGKFGCQSPSAATAPAQPGR